MDNGSSDDSAIKASKLKEVTVHFLEENLGFAAANNRAIALCDCDWVALLNPDALPDKDWLLNLIQASQEHPDISVFGSRQMSLNSPNIIDGTGDIYHCSGLIWRHGHGIPYNQEDNVEKLIFSPCACAGLYRLEV